VAHEYGISLIDTPIGKYDAIVLAVGHHEYKILDKATLESMANGDLLLFDIKGVKNGKQYENYWKL
jgi:UDP-N-acetyl-D-galactosamine dehydrogenase